MSQQTYPVACECGKVHQCPTGYAGSKFACHCGKPVEVPGLSDLRRMALEQGVPAEHEVELRIREESLPIETECVLCGEVTPAAVMTGLICSPIKPTPTHHWWLWFCLTTCAFLLIAYPGFFVILLAVYLFVVIPVFLWWRIKRPPQKPGKWFTVPVRVCDECAPRMDDPAGASEAVNATPLYRRLLEGYPDAVISRPGWILDSRLVTQESRERQRGLVRGVAFAVSAVATFFPLKYALDAWASTFPYGLGLAWHMGLFLIAAVSLLCGYGAARATAGVHRHFFPKLAKESSAQEKSS
jgi:hypothetical protein